MDKCKWCGKPISWMGGPGGSWLPLGRPNDPDTKNGIHKCKKRKVKK